MTTLLSILETANRALSTLDGTTVTSGAEYFKLIHDVLDPILLHREDVALIRGIPRNADRPSSGMSVTYDIAAKGFGLQPLFQIDKGDTQIRADVRGVWIRLQAVKLALYKPRGIDNDLDVSATVTPLMEVHEALKVIRAVYARSNIHHYRQRIKLLRAEVKQLQMQIKTEGVYL